MKQQSIPHPWWHGLFTSVESFTLDGMCIEYRCTRCRKIYRVTYVEEFERVDIRRPLQ